MIFRILNANDEPVDARIELDGGSVVIHSRGGSTGGRPPRNTGYQEALGLLIQRLMAEPVSIEGIYIDSAEAHRRSPDASARILVDGAEIATLGSPLDVVRSARTRASRFGQVPGATGGNSTKQLRIETDRNADFLRNLLRLTPYTQSAAVHLPAGSGSSRLTAAQQARVTSDDIYRAVSEVAAGFDMPNFYDSRDYDLLTADGLRLAPKKVFGRALEIAGVVSKADPKHFSAGWSEPSFRLLQAAGYSIVPKTSAAAEARWKKVSNHATVETLAAAQAAGVNPEELSWIEGDRRIAGHLRIERKRSARAAAAKRMQIRAANNGRLTCERCETDWYAVYSDDLAEAVFDVHHTIPLKDMDEGHETKVEDLLCLCANCHRIEHRRLAGL